MKEEITKNEKGDEIAMYELRFWFEHGGICLWGMNSAAREKYGYAIESSLLPISNDLLNELNTLEEIYATYLDWDYPPNPSPWTEAEKREFIERANSVHEKLCKELGKDYFVKNEILSCVV